MANLAPAVAPGALGPDPQARVLASLLRGARVSLLLGTAPADRGWADSLLPLLCRRAADRAVITDAAYGRLPAVPERRRRRTEPLPHQDVELAVRLDDWATAPLDAWRRAIDTALAQQGLDCLCGPGPLADVLVELSRRAGLRFLFLFERFDGYLAAPPEHHEVQAFGDEWVRVMGHPACAAHTMVALDDGADVLLQRFAHRIPRLGDSWLRLGSPDPAAADDGRGATATAEAQWSAGITALVDRVSAAARGQGAGAVASLLPLRTADVYDSVEAMLARVAAQNRQEAWHGEAGLPAAPAAAPAAQPLAARAAPPVAAEPQPAAGPVEAPSAPAPAAGSASIGAGIALAVAALGLAWLLSRSLPSELNSGAGEAPAAGPVPALPTAAPKPRLVVRWSAEEDGGARAVQDLARSLGSDAGLDVAGSAASDWRSVWATDASGAPAPLALLRYEALQAAQRLSTPPGLQIVTPLFTQELQLRVRADSPLRYIHQIEGRRIDVGPAQGERALTAAVLYRRMFAKPLPPGAGHAALDEAMQSLRAGQVDVVLAVGSWPQGTVAGTRPLVLDSRHPASRRALQAFLPGKLRVEGVELNTLASLLFLVAPSALAPEQSALVSRLVRAWCEALPTLRRDGDPKWREFQPGMALDVGWPTLPEAAQAWRQCAAGGDAPHAPAPQGSGARPSHPGA